MDGPGIDEVTSLVLELINGINSKHEIRQNTNQLANIVLQRENEKFRILEKYQHDNDLLLDKDNDSALEFLPSFASQSEPHLKSSSLTLDDDLLEHELEPESESRQLLQENLQLRVELQKLQEMETKSNDLICGYELAMANIRTGIEGYVRSYKPSINWIVDSYKTRLNEEQELYDELKRSHDRLLFNLASLRDTLKKGTTNLGEAIEDYQSKAN